MRLDSWIRRERLVMLSPTENLPSVAKFIGGKNVTAKWWSHPKGNEIHNASQVLFSDPDILALKLVEGKVTFVHRTLWPILLSLALNPERKLSQTSSLDDSAEKLLTLVNSSPTLRLDFLAPDWKGGAKRLKRDRVKLENRGLALTHDEHTDQGIHQTVIESWEHFRKRNKIKTSELPSVFEATSILKKIIGTHKTVLTN
jgi:hypothetical protein